MRWWESTVQIHAWYPGEPMSSGSGCIVEDGFVLTAAHVVAPAASTLHDLDHVVVMARYTGAVGSVTKFAVHPEWVAEGLPYTDMALLKVDWGGACPRASLAADVGWGGPSPKAASGFGFVGTYHWHRSGTVKRVPAPGGFDFYGSSDLFPIDGVSGGPLVSRDDDVPRVVGVITRARTEPGFGFVGLPLGKTTYAALRRDLSD